MGASASVTDDCEPSGRATVIAPLLEVEVAIEDDDAIHFHAGGQGFWIAQLLRELGIEVVLVAAVGGEAGVVAASLVECRGVRLEAVHVATSTGAVVHDRRGGSPQLVASVEPSALDRHGTDDLFGVALVSALEASVCVIAGPGRPPVVEPDLYPRLARDLVANRVRVVADVSGDLVEPLLGADVDVVKVSADDLVTDGQISSTDLDDVTSHGRWLVAGRAGMLVVSRAEAGSVSFSADGVHVVRTPAVSAIEERGAGDSFTAGLAAALARGAAPLDALRVAAAAGTVNATRRGLGTGQRATVERIRALTSVERMDIREGPCER